MVPKGWSNKKLEELVSKEKYSIVDGPFGSNLKSEHYRKEGIPVLQSGFVTSGKFKATTYSYVERELFEQQKRSAAKAGDIVMAKIGAQSGRCAVVPDNHPISIIAGNCLKLTFDENEHNTNFMWSALTWHYEKNSLSEIKTETAQPAISLFNLKKYKILTPPLIEQRKIADIFSVWDQTIATTENLLNNSQLQKKAFTQILLGGKRRLLQFRNISKLKSTTHGKIPDDWKFVSIGSVATQVSKKNIERENLPVLSCSKHYGFVDSLKYFNKKIYSDDTSTYKIIEKGCFGFPSNHIEEGSIGYQNLYDVGIVSPIYIIFRANNTEVYDLFLYALLKTDRYKQIFCAATNASVDRRGSLRWDEFSKIKI
jgi:type I restriction enzyme S subunit